MRCSRVRPCQRCTSKGHPCDPSTTAVAVATLDQDYIDTNRLPPTESYSVANSQLQQKKQPFLAVVGTEAHDRGPLGHTQPSTQALVGPDMLNRDTSGQSQAHMLEPYHPGEYLCKCMQYSVSLTMPGHTITFHAPDPFLEFDCGFDDVFMGNFLDGIINTDSGNSISSYQSTELLPDVLHYGFDEFVSFPSVTTQMQSAGTRPNKDRLSTSHSGTETPAVRTAVHAGEQAFRESMWLWDPLVGDSSVSEQIHLALPGDHSSPRHHREVDKSVQLSIGARDRLLSMVLTTCEPRVQRQVIRSFPSTEVLSSLVSDCKQRHNRQISPWIHFPTLDLDNEPEEFLAALVSAGAADARQPELQRLGFAMQETARLAIMKRFEEENIQRRGLRSIQALLLILIVGLNSASRRKIEIAESSTLAVVTMLRRGGRFWSTRDPLVLLQDDGLRSQSTVRQWKSWAEEESFKRLAYHVLFQDAQTSAALYRQPVIAYSEINLIMPCLPEIWHADSAERWHVYASRRQSRQTPPPLTLHSCLKETGLLSLHSHQTDIQMSLRIMVTIFWSRVWQFVQLRAFSTLQEGSPSFTTTNQLHQQLVATSQDLLVRFSEEPDSMHPCVRMMLEVGLMHLHVSLEDIQFLAGKEGEEHARHAASRLRLWMRLPESRQALFHAGQIAKAASQCPAQYLRGFHAVMIYHASLTMWAYALLSTMKSTLLDSRESGLINPESHVPSIPLDGDENPQLRRFILLGTGNPCIQEYSHSIGNLNTETTQKISLTDAAEVMRSMAGLLASLDNSEHYCVPIVSYLTRLMHSLARASAAMKLLR